MKKVTILSENDLKIVIGGNKGGVPNADVVKIFLNLINADIKSNGHALGTATTGFCNALKRNAHPIDCQL